MPQLGEHDAFKFLTESLEQAVSAATAVSHFRPDQRNGWLKIAEALNVTKEACFRLAADGVVRTRQ